MFCNHLSAQNNRACLNHLPPRLRCIPLFAWFRVMGCAIVISFNPLLTSYPPILDA